MTKQIKICTPDTEGRLKEKCDEKDIFISLSNWQETNKTQNMRISGSQILYLAPLDMAYTAISNGVDAWCEPSIRGSVAYDGVFDRFFFDGKLVKNIETEKETDLLKVKLLLRGVIHGFRSEVTGSKLSVSPATLKTIKKITRAYPELFSQERPNFFGEQASFNREMKRKFSIRKPAKKAGSTFKGHIAKLHQFAANAIHYKYTLEDSLEIYKVSLSTDRYGLENRHIAEFNRKVFKRAYRRITRETTPVIPFIERIAQYKAKQVEIRKLAVVEAVEAQQLKDIFVARLKSNEPGLYARYIEGESLQDLGKEIIETHGAPYSPEVVETGGELTAWIAKLHDWSLWRRIESGVEEDQNDWRDGLRDLPKLFAWEAQELAKKSRFGVYVDPELKAEINSAFAELVYTSESMV